MEKSACVQQVPLCRGLTARGRPCRRRAVAESGFCYQHGAASFYARAFSEEDRAAYEEALNQEGLTGEVAVLRLHLLRLLERNEPGGSAEIPRTVHALVRAIKDARGTSNDALAALDAAIREEGRRWLDDGEAARNEVSHE
ncbi:MAG TPA: DUF5763 domain-containing protein [Chloroflexota bacterium]|nr:DUF5763 domain-containing protein [Chloroflexota bacterium]